MKLAFAQTDETGPTVRPTGGTFSAQQQADRPLSHAERAAPLRFDMPRRVFAQLLLVTAGYLVVMGVALREGHGIGLLFAVFALVGLGYYGLPRVLAKASGATRDPFAPRGAWGVDTASGYISGRSASAQVMTVPLLVLVWAVVVAVII